MNSSLIWFGFLPIVAFLLVDAFAGRRRALWAALLLGTLELAYTVSVFGAMDYISVIGFLILAGFVYLSLRRDDDYFFKVHGAVINLLLAAIMLVSWYAFDKALLLDVAEKYVGLDKLVEANPRLDRVSVAATFRVMSVHLPGWLVLHSLLTFSAAANWGKWAWAFVRIPGFILMLIVASAFAQSSILR